MKNYIGFKALDMGFDAHLTMLYTGDLSFDQVRDIEFALEHMSLKYNGDWVERKALDLFGPIDSDTLRATTPVVVVNVSENLKMLREILIDMEFPNPSEYPWNPHISLDFSSGMHTIKIPPMIRITNLGLY